MLDRNIASEITRILKISAPRILEVGRIGTLLDVLKYIVMCTHFSVLFFDCVFIGSSIRARCHSFQIMLDALVVVIINVFTYRIF